MSMTTRPQKANVLYLSIVGGKMMQSVDEDHPDAEKRVFEKSDKTKGVKYEVEHRNLTGHITGITLEKSDYGTQCRVTLESGTDKAVLSFPYESDYFMDFAKRICGADLTQPVTLNPYSIKDEGKEYSNRGISVKQGETKLMNHFYDPETKETINGMPSVSEKERKTYDTDEWKVYFTNVRSFLKKQVLSLEIPKYEGVVDSVIPNTTMTSAGEEEPAGSVEDEKLPAFLRGKK